MNMKGYKGLTDKLQGYGGYQYEIGKTYTQDGDLELCHNGLHFCENPLDVLGYFAPATSRYAEVEADNVSGEKEDDTKRVCKTLKITAEIGLQGLINAGIEYIKSQVNWDDNKKTNTGDYSAATNTGDYSAATNTGDRSVATNAGDYSAATNTGYQSAATNTGYQSAATNTGDYSAATNTGHHSAASVDGKESVAISLGIEGKAKANLGSWIVLAEWSQDKNGTWHRKSVKSYMVDGKKIKANTYYYLKHGKLTIAKGDN